MAKAFLDKFEPLNVAVITISDTRTIDTDTSGNTLKELLQKDGHNVVYKTIVVDDIKAIREAIQNVNSEVIITTGGTGFTSRDNTLEAVYPLITKHITGFGEIFRSISYAEIGTSAMQSNAFAGFINKKLVFCIPGSTNACKTAYESIISSQLNSTVRPCNFAALIKLGY
ncbi:MAG: molybdenum cofactor biosynthesis protein [Alphaproteobacteria bacterium]|jgi:molybdenum cofactor biosynthesis protein B|nr:molybdenum cofactor biosynthesis protein [Alphaproteobacteria bacterium]